MRTSGSRKYSNNYGRKIFVSCILWKMDYIVKFKILRILFLWNSFLCYFATRTVARESIRTIVLRKIFVFAIIATILDIKFKINLKIYRIFIIIYNYYNYYNIHPFIIIINNYNIIQYISYIKCVCTCICTWILLFLVRFRSDLFKSSLLSFVPEKSP